MKQHSLLLSLVTIASFPAAGCTAYSTPPPSTEVPSDDAPPPPPPAQVEVIPVSPGPEYVWVGGFHRWDGRRYVWIGGHYDRRPALHAHYVRGHWEHRGRVTVWVDGRWI
jgi:hypothetical protein